MYIHTKPVFIVVLKLLRYTVYHIYIYNIYVISGDNGAKVNDDLLDDWLNPTPLTQQVSYEYC